MKTGHFLVAGMTAALLTFAPGAFGATLIVNVNMNGQNELIGGRPDGDLDGSAIGSITLDTGPSNNAGIITFNLALANLANPAVTDFHIHTGAFNQQGGVLIPIGVAGGDVLTATTFSGTRTLSAGDTTDLNNVLANPANFYFNIHNIPFPSGAVRAQVPEPATFGLAALGSLALLRRTRRA